ncbi:MAG: ABC transporter ATP-binding protein [Patulibacter sp.]
MAHESPQPAPALTARGLTRRRQGRTILDGVDLDVGAGERVAILGPNGAGKTTLLEVIAGVQPAHGGTVEPGPHALGWVPQRPALYERLTVAENLRLFAGLTPGAGNPADATQRALDFAQLRDRAGQRLDRLSGGWRQRVSLAIGLLGTPRCLLLDEPHTALDPPQRLALWELIDRLAEQGTGVVITTHELHSAERHADRVVVLCDGRVAFSGTAAQLRALGGDHDDLDRAFARVVAGTADGQHAAPEAGAGA